MLKYGRLTLLISDKENFQEYDEIAIQNPVDVRKGTLFRY
jgi:hypothetical protein